MNANYLESLCQQLRLPTTASRVAKACEQATRQQLSHEQFLTELLDAELETRAQKRLTRLVKEAKFPSVKTLESFNFSRSPHLPETLLRELAQGKYIDNAQPIILIGEPGTGKTHLACALGYAAAQAGTMVRFTTTAQLVNLLVEAKDNRVLSVITARYSRYKLLILDELGYVPLTKADSELLFQVISQRQERLPLIITTNLPFSEWTSVFPDHRLCKALIDRITYKAHIIETGENSIRFEETLKKHKGGKLK
jgi:DNA replication protein DnaC